MLLLLFDLVYFWGVRWTNLKITSPSWCWLKPFFCSLTSCFCVVHPSRVVGREEKNQVKSPRIWGIALMGRIVQLEWGLEIDS